MATITAAECGSPNIPLFLDLVAWSEGTSTSHVTQRNGYDVLVSGIHGPSIFTDLGQHPNILVTVNHNGLESTAAGRYQELHRNFVAMQPELHLPDFGPLSQDKMAIQHLKECGALPYVESGDIQTAIAKASGIWASFPGNDYGQRAHPMELLLDQWERLKAVAPVPASA